MFNIDPIPSQKNYLNVRVYRTSNSTINNWDRVTLEFYLKDRLITNAYYVNGLQLDSERLIRNIPIPANTLSIKLNHFGDFNISSVSLEKDRTITDFESKLISEQLDCYNGQFFFNYPSKLPPRKLIVTLPGMGNNIDINSQHALMTMQSFPFKEDVYRLHLVDFFWANGSCLIFDENNRCNIDNIISIIDSILVKNNISPSECHIITASKGCFAGYEIMQRKQYKFAFFAPITNVAKFNENSPVFRFTSREMINKGYKFAKPNFLKNATVYTSLKDPGIELGLLSECLHTIDQNLMHSQITKHFMGQYLSSENII